jgi:hypothetical protein
MPRGIDPAPKTSLNSADQTTKLGVSAAVSTLIVYGPTARGISTVPDEPGGVLPR